MWRRILGSFSPIVWHDVGPQADWDRNWPELVAIVASVVLVGRSAPVAVQVGLLVAGFGMWWLGIVLGWARLSRIWMGLLGVWVIGSFGAGPSTVWLPWAVAWTWAAMRWRRPLYAAAASLALALVLLGENTGLTMATFLVSVLFLGLASFRWQRARPYVVLRSQRAILVATIVLFGIGLASVKLITSSWWWQVEISALIKGLATWGMILALAPIGYEMDRLLRWAVAHRWLARIYVPAVAGWAAAWLLLAVSWLLVILLLFELSRQLQAVTMVAAVRFSDLFLDRQLILFLLQRSALTWLGLGLSGTALTGVVSLAIEDRQRRRNELQARVVYENGGLRPIALLDLPDGTPVYLVFEEPVQGVASTLSEAVNVEQLVAGSPASATTQQIPVQSAVATQEASQPSEPTSISSQLTSSAPPMNPWQLPSWQGAFFLFFAVTVSVILFLRLYQLDSLQREIYGDIMIVRNYVTNVLGGRWPIRFDLSAGPLYHYLIAPIVVVVGTEYLGIKVASVVVSLLALSATYLFSRELVNDFFALLTMYIAGVSSWLLIFSRLGNSQILLPVLTATSLWLVIRVLKYGRRVDLVAAAVVSTLGLYVYPQSFILPGVIFLTLLLMRWAGFSLKAREMGLFILIVLLCAMPFLLIVRADPANFTAGYIGSKIKAEGSFWALLGNNIVKALMAFHARGDEGFRSNPVGLPHLDWISGVLFLVGIVYWLVSRDRRRWLILLVVPFLLLQVPSVMALNQPREVPSASRTLGIVPIVYLLVATGVWWLIQELRRRFQGVIVPALAAVLLLGGILLLNVDRYFKRYINGLPYQDTPIGRLIADYANALPQDTHVYMVGCCWVYSIPDRFVDKEVARPRNFHYVEPNQLSCVQLQHMELPAVLIWSFRDTLPAPQLESCRHWLPAQLFTHKERPIFYAAPLRPDLPPLAEDTDEAAQLREHLEATSVDIDGQQVDLVYSRLDMGAPANMFDGDIATLARGLEDNPFILDFVFSQPRSVRGLIADFANMDFVVTAKLYPEIRTTPQVYSREYRGLPGNPHIEMDFEDAPDAVRRLRLEILQLNPPLDVHIHVREVKFR